MSDPQIAFLVEPHAAPALEIRVNFGIFAGRQATGAEIERLAARLLDTLGSVTVVAEERLDVVRGRATSLHQIRIELTPDQVGADQASRDELAEHLLAHARAWVEECIADRSG